MAQTKRRRRRKRRGTQAGTVDARARQRSRPRSRAEARARAGERRRHRFDRMPTLSSAMPRAGLAAALFTALMLVIGEKPVNTVVLGVFAFLIYLPVSYWFDRFMWRRSQRKKAQQGDP